MRTYKDYFECLCFACDVVLIQDSSVQRNEKKKNSRNVMNGVTFKRVWIPGLNVYGLE
jgi:hypothetical protein